MFTAVALPHLVKAAPRPILCASSENARSASLRLLIGGGSVIGARVDGATSASGSSGAIIVSDTSPSGRRARL